jgi:hypothetical protein
MVGDAMADMLSSFRAAVHTLQSTGDRYIELHASNKIP